MTGLPRATIERPAIDKAKHHPTLLATGRHGCWATCSCGWQSTLYTTTTGAHLAFGQHLTSPNGEG